MKTPPRLYMLPFDHRDSFEHRLFGFAGALDSEETAQVTIWKIEGLDSTSDCQNVAGTALLQGRLHVRCIVLGRNAPEAEVERWLRAAAAVPAFIGFAVGRSTFADPLRAWRDRSATREQAAHEISRRYGQWTRTFADAQASGRGAPTAPEASR